MKAELEFEQKAPAVQFRVPWDGTVITISGWSLPLSFMQELQRRWNAGEEKK